MKSFFTLLTLSVALASSSIAEEKTNFLLCMTDDQGWGDIGYNGHPELKTPELDKMAALYRVGPGNGVSSVTPATSCVQDSHAALFMALNSAVTSFLSSLMRFTLSSGSTRA